MGPRGVIRCKKKPENLLSFPLFHVRMKQEGRHLKARQRALLPRAESASTSDFPASRVLEISVCCLNYPVCGTLLGRPKRTAQGLAQLPSLLGPHGLRATYVR